MNGDPCGQQLHNRARVLGPHQTGVRAADQGDGATRGADLLHRIPHPQVAPQERIEAPGPPFAAALSSRRPERTPGDIVRDEQIGAALRGGEAKSRQRRLETRIDGMRLQLAHARRRSSRASRARADARARRPADRRAPRRGTFRHARPPEQWRFFRRRNGRRRPGRGPPRTGPRRARPRGLPI